MDMGRTDYGHKVFSCQQLHQTSHALTWIIESLGKPCTPCELTSFRPSH